MQAYSLALDIISGCWLVFVAIWVLAALSTKRTVYRETQAQRLRYWVLLVIACFLQLYGRRLPYPLNIRVLPHARALGERNESRKVPRATSESRARALSWFAIAPRA